MNVQTICLGDLGSIIYRFLGTLEGIFNIQQFIYYNCHLPRMIYNSMNCYIAFHLHVTEESAQLSGPLVKAKF